MKNQTFLKMKRLIDIINTDNEPNIINDMVFGDDNVKRNNMSKQTAVEWLFAHLLPFIDFSDLKEREYFIKCLAEAKAMEKEQMEDAWKDGMKSDIGHFGTAEQYYNNTYNK